MELTSKQVVTMVVAVSLTAVFAPVGVYAATGQLVNIVDPGSGRAAHVTSNSALFVESRAARGSQAFNMRNSRFGFGWIRLVGTTGPNRIAVTELTLAGQYDAGKVGEVLLEAFVRTSGTNSCEGPGTAGYERHTLKHVWVSSRQTLQLTWAGQAMVLPIAPPGQPTCFGVTYYAGDTNMTIYADGTGYLYQ